jgi:hypothetical protein
VPLSEHEQRLLDQIERALYAEDPKFASTVRSTDLRAVMRRRIRYAVLLFLVGFGLMLFFVKNPAFGIAGFAVMVGAFALALSAWKRMGGTPATLRAVEGRAERPTRRAKGGRKSQGKSHGSAKQRLEERWQRRWDERGGPR